MWERFSFYGMRALLILYMTAPIAAGGLGLPVPEAASLYGLYTSAVYLASLPGGWIADRFLGQQEAVFWGGILITLGQFVLLSPDPTVFRLGLGMIVAGTGLLKSNASALVGQLYAAGDRRRDAGFSVFYMGINLGAMISPLICGYLGEKINYRYGFAAAGLGMILGLIQYQLGRPTLGLAGRRPMPGASPAQPLTARGWNQEELSRLAALGVLVAASAIFWSLYEQAGSTLNLFALERVRSEIFGWAFPASWFQSVPALMVIALAPAFAWLWVRLGKRDPSPVIKFTLGLLLAGLGFLLLVPAAQRATGGLRVSPWWLVGTYFLHTVGELCLSPVGLSATTKLAPARAAGLLMGVWFLSIALGNFLGGKMAGFYRELELSRLFGNIAALGIAAGLVLALLTRPMNKLMGEAR